MKRLYECFFRMLVKAAHWLYHIEGVNACLLIAPAKLIPDILRSYQAAIGTDTEIHSPIFIHNAGKNYAHLTIGNGCYVGRSVFFDLKEPVVLEDRATLSMRVSLLTHFDAGRAQVKTFLPVSSGPIRVCRYSYLGAGAILLAGVTVGECSAVGAGSVVLKSIGGHELYAGNPAVKIRDLH